MTKPQQSELSTENVYERFTSLREFGAVEECVDFVSDYEKSEYCDDSLARVMWTEIREMTRDAEELWMQRELDYKQMVYGS